MDVGKRLKELRLKNNLTQKEICDKFYFGYTTYNAWEKGRGKPDIETLIILSDFYNVSVDYLIGKNDSPTLSSFESKFRSLSEDEQMLIYNLILKLLEKKKI